MNQGSEQSGVRHAWAFAALSIQTYILETGRLADAVGASLLVDQLTGDLTDSDADDSLLAIVMSASKVRLGTDLRFARRGGGAFIAVFDDREALCRTRLLWQAALHQNAPGLRWTDGLGSDTNSGAAVEVARVACEDNGRVDMARLPEAGPLVLRVARTGQPASVRRSLGEKGTEALDAASEARRRHGATRAGQGRLTDRFSTEPGLVWPRHMELADEQEGGTGDEGLTKNAARHAQRFPFLSDDHEVAILHADGNGVGALLARIRTETPPANYLKVHEAFSKAVAEATRQAAGEATQRSLLPYARPNPDTTRTVPARPLVLGGDDLTLIVRADLALEFATVFLNELESRTTKMLKDVRTGGEVLGTLTATCGIAFVKSTFPFHEGVKLAEWLCTEAKQAIQQEARTATGEGRKGPLSAIAMHRVTTALADVGRPTVRLGGKTVPLGHVAYVFPPDGKNTGLPCWKDLDTLAQLLGTEASSRGPVRTLLIDMQQSPGMARERYRRWRSLRNAEANEALDNCLQRLGIPKGHDLPLSPSGSPWPDALLLAELKGALERTKKLQDESAR